MKKFLQNVFSIRNEQTHKIVKILGIKIKLKRTIRYDYSPNPIKEFFEILFNLHPKKELLYNPFGLIIDTTLLCNNNCSFCWRKNNTEYLKNLNSKMNIKTMDFETYKKIIDDACQYNSITWLSLCGPMGEPLMNDRIEDFFEYAYNKNHFNKITINTNGLAINKRDIQRLLNSINEFSISLDSINPETYEKIHGHKNMEQVINNIKSLVEYKKQNGCVADIWVRFTENKYNKGQFEEFKKFVEDLGVDYINYTKEHSFIDVNNNIGSSMTARKCTQPYLCINYNFLGDMTTCCINWHLSPVFGNIKDKTIKEVWESRKMRLWEFRTKYLKLPKPCNDCSGLCGDIGQAQHIKVEKKEKICQK